MSNPYTTPESGKAAAKRQLKLTVPPVPMPRSKAHRIALVGCGAIGKVQLGAYSDAGWNVVLLCDRNPPVVEAARAAYFPNADVVTDFKEVLARDDVTVVDLALHLDVRPRYVKEALLAGKHVMSQKPFVERISDGMALAQLAEDQGLLLAVNQNGRWAPHFRALREVVHGGHLGQVYAADFSTYWGHDQILESHVLGKDPNLLLYDFAIHWFDLIADLLPEAKAKSVYAVTGHREGQLIPVPTLASVIIGFDSAQVSISMRASARGEDSGYFHVAGPRGLAKYAGHSLGGEAIEVVNDAGQARVATSANWFPDALTGSMANLLCAIEAQEVPSAHPRSSLPGLQLCFAAMESAARGAPVDPASVEALPG